MIMIDLLNFPRFPEAKCKGDIADFFFPENKKQLEEALPTLRSLCGSCIHEKECLKYALDNEITHGYWGNKTTDERNVLALSHPKVQQKQSNRVKDVLRLKNAGWSNRAIAKSFDISETAIRRLLNNAVKEGQ